MSDVNILGGGVIKPSPKKEQLKLITYEKMKNIFGNVIDYDKNIINDPVEFRRVELTIEFTEFIRLNLLEKGVSNPYGFTELMNYLNLDKNTYMDLLNGQLNLNFMLIAEVELYFGKQFIKTESND